jgi:YebC/PmpR family DNA-binding regulatory protein
MGRGPSIEGRKSVEDAKRGKLFTKLIREITVAARIGGGDPGGNPRLRAAMDKALDANMPKDTIERALKRGSGEGGGALDEIRYEGYGPGGVALLVDCMTDNPTRTVSEVRHAFSKCGGHLGTSGSVAFQFSKVGQIFVDVSSDPALEEKVLDAALEAGADDVQNHPPFAEVLTSAEQFAAVRKALEGKGIVLTQADVVMRAANVIAVAGEQAEQLKKLTAMLEELDDVQAVFSNADYA